jgi:hypothetical protein
MNSESLKKLGLTRISESPLPAEERVRAVETSLGFPFSGEYKHFLRSYGASLFTEDVGFEPVQASPWTSEGLNTLDVLYGISTDIGFDISHVNERLKGDIPADSIAVGHDPGSNLLLLNRQGEVLFFDKETGQVYLCAHSFSAFLESFRLRS